MIGLLLALASSSQAEPIIDGPPQVWLAEHSPFGFDVTPDGKVWINMDQHGQGADYSVLANDVYKADRRYPYVWIRGNFKHDPRVSYRETKQRISFDCEGDKITTYYSATYSPNGSTVWAGKTHTEDMVVPGSNADRWKTFICAIKDTKQG